MIRAILIISALVLSSTNFAQIFGPNNPTVYNTTGTGYVWSGSATAVFGSDNSYATSSGAGTGLTLDLRARTFGFNLLSTDIVQGIQVDVEKKANSLNNVALLNGWQDGQLSTINNYPLSAGNNRLMIVYVGIENGNTPTVTSVTYGGLNMTQLISINNNTGFQAQLEVWYLTEAQLISLTPGNYNVNVNLGGFAQNEYFDIISAATFANVDPISPFLNIQTGNTSGGTPNPWQLPSPLTVGVGGVAVNGVFCGNNKTPAVTNGGTNCWTINSGFIEGTDVYRANMAVAPTSGGCFQSAHKFSLANGTEQPSTTFNGTSNRRIVIAFSLRRASVVDNVVRLQKAGVNVGSNLAQTTTYWPITDTYVSYGGPTNMWGTTWTYTDINAPLFGASIKAMIYNGVAEVDHIRITVYTQSNLPVELMDFNVGMVGENVGCSWLTSSERNSDYFDVENSTNGFDWLSKGTVQAAGNSMQLMSYSFLDESPSNGQNYYRLKQVDIDGKYTYSEIKSIVFSGIESSLVYPNPLATWGSVYTQKNDSEPQILDAIGRKIIVSNARWENNVFHFDMSDQTDGAYFIQINDAKGNELKPFIKRSF